MSEKNTTQSTTPENIIKTHVQFTMIASTIPIPIVDIAAVTAIQLDMIKQLATHYNVDYNSERGKSLVTTIVGTSFGTMLARTGASVVKGIPGLGTLIGIGSQVVISSAITYAIGKVFNNHFQNNGDLFNFETELIREKFQEFFEKGKEFVGKLKKEENEDTIMETISKLKELRDNGTITEDEFEQAKKDLLKKLGK